MKSGRFPGLFLWLLIFCTVNAKNELIKDDQALELESLFEDYHRWRLSNHPEEASLIGFHEFDSLLTDYSVEGAEEMGKKCEEFKERAETILNKMTEDDGKTENKRLVKLLREEADICSRGAKFKGHVFAPISLKGSVQKSLPADFKKNGFFKLNNIDDFDAVFERLEAIPSFLEGIRNSLKEGMRQNMTFPMEALRNVKESFDALKVEKAEDSQFFHPFTTTKFDQGNKEKMKVLRQKAKDVILDTVLPAFADLHSFLETEYMPHARPHEGIWSIPNGDEFYQACIDYHATIKNLTADEIHEIGKESIKDLRRKVMAVAQNLDHNGTFEEFMDKLRTEQEFKFNSKEEALQLLNEILYDRINPRLKTIFKEEHLTKMVFAVDIEVPPPPSGATAYYENPSRDGSRNGTFYINLNNLETYQKTISTTLTLHEANPGHHLQTVYRRGLDLPAFVTLVPYNNLVRAPSITPVFTAFTEGWGLYAESLGFDLNVFDDPYQLLGFYSYNLLRSARLVVDTGIHSLRWTRQMAVEYLRNNTAFTDEYINLQVDRYINLPGQALAYRLGERTISGLREKKQKELGEEFDLKQFHADVLRCQGPLYDLETCINNLNMLSDFN